MKLRIRLLFLSITIASFDLLSQNVTNYTFSAVSGVFTPIQGSPGSVSPALTAGSWDDGYFNNIPIGFTFLYDGTQYTAMSASTNGWARFSATAGGSFNGNSLNTGTNRPVVAPLWDDLMLNPGCFTYKTTGTAPNRICTLEWLNVYWSYLAANPGISFQVKLYEANRRIEFIYRQEAGTISASSASVGIGGFTSGQFLSLNNTTTSPTASSVTETTTIFSPPLSGQIYRFDHYALVPAITSVSPATGYINTIITITGNNFDIVPSSLAVWCGATKATVTSASYTQITAIVPRGTDLQHISVTDLSSGRTAEADEQYDVQFGCGTIFWSGAFSSAVSFSSGSGSRCTDIADIDGDGKTDVAVSSDGSGGVAIFRNISTTGSFTAASLAPAVSFTSSAGQPGDIQFTDLDGDGKKDMLVADYSTTSLDSISVFRNTATPGSISASSFATRVTFKVPGYPSLTSADIDGDGKPEMIAACRVSDQLIIRRNQSTPGTITTASFGANVVFATRDAPEEVAAADFDGDGKIDLAVINGFDYFLSVFRNTATPGVINASSFATRLDIASLNYGSDLQIADMDGDGKQDVVVCYSNYAQMSVFLNTSTPGNVSFTRTDISIGSGLSQCLDLGDMDGDGKADIVLKHSNPVIIHNTSTAGALSFGSPVSFFFATSPFEIACGDLDGDSKPEIITTLLSAGTVSVLHNQMSSFNAIAPLTVLNATPYCDDGTWKTYCDPLDNTKVLFAVKDNGINLGTVTVDEYRDPAPGNYLGNRFLQRHFRINPTIQPSGSVQVRLFYTNAELTNLMAVDPNVMGTGSLSVTKYDGPTEDGTYFPGDATSLVWIPPASITTGTLYGGNYLQFSVSSFSEFWIHGGSGVLPIELLSFDALPVNHSVELNWQTASETNNDYFTIERSQNGSDLESIDTIDGAGNSTSVLDYHTNDYSPYEGLSYYRLKQVDFNGNFSYSGWKMVYMESVPGISIFPNPTDGYLTLDLTGETDALWTLTILDLSGKTVFDQQAPRTAFQRIYLDLAAGSYILRLETAGVNYSQQLVITE